MMLPGFPVCLCGPSVPTLSVPSPTIFWSIADIGGGRVGYLSGDAGGVSGQFTPDYTIFYIIADNNTGILTVRYNGATNGFFASVSSFKYSSISFPIISLTESTNTDIAFDMSSMQIAANSAVSVQLQ